MNDDPEDFLDSVEWAIRSFERVLKGIPGYNSWKMVAWSTILRRAKYHMTHIEETEQ